MYNHYRSVGLGVLILLALIGSALAQSVDRAPTNVTVTITPYNPPVTIPGAGGSFACNVTVDTDDALSLEFDVWTVYTLADDSVNEPGYGPVDLLLPGGWSAQEDLSQVIPGGMPAGVYTYTAYAGLFPDEVWGSDSFEFEKLPSAVGWYLQSPGAENGLTGVSFVDANNGWAVSSYREIIHTTDGGDIWQPQDDGQYYPHEYNDVHFVDTQSGWVVGHGWSLGGTILHTTDGGTTWIEQDPDTDYELNSVFFVDTDNGWAVGGYFDIYGSNHRQVIEHTADGGDSWEEQYWQSYRYPFQSVYFADADHGWAVGGPGYIQHTIDGGDNWTEQDSGTSSYLQDVFFVDDNLGWCVGDDGKVLFTTDGGVDWQTRFLNTTADFRSVFFADPNTGWIAGVDYIVSRPVIYNTVDGGLSWQAQDTGTDDDLIVLHDICFVDASHGWVAGQLWPDVGVMLHTENGGGLVTGVTEPGLPETMPERVVLAAPFPNPFNPQTTITFSLGRDAWVAVGIYELTGRRVAILADRTFGGGEHALLWSGRDAAGRAVPSGTYIVRLESEFGVESRKVMLLR